MASLEARVVRRRGQLSTVTVTPAGRGLLRERTCAVATSRRSRGGVKVTFQALVPGRLEQALAWAMSWTR